MGTFYLSTFRNPYFFTLTWVKKFSQYFYFYQSIFNHEYLYFYLSKGCVYFCHPCSCDIINDLHFKDKKVRVSMACLWK